MYKFFILLTIFFITYPVSASEYKYILNEAYINSIYEPAKNIFQDTEIKVLKEAQGVILRFEIKNPIEEYLNLSKNTINKISQIEYFLAKIKNFVIIEVHVKDSAQNRPFGLRDWEISTVIANNIESLLYKLEEDLDKDRVISVGYGGFLPQKNTPYNGGKYNNRVDIIILYNVNGE